MALKTDVRPTKRLRVLLESPDLEFLMEAHSGLSARIVERVGFRGIWASGLTIASTLGLRDSNEASWTQVLEVVEHMTDATELPILVDGDTGYGNFNNARILVAKLCQRGAAGVCIEDKLFPKTNSFLGARQPLADIEEFRGKIAACKDHQPDPDFVVVARTEALVSGRSLQEAIDRAGAYREAGADAILVHSKSKEATEILEFAAKAKNLGPLVIVPTTYHQTPTDTFRNAGISLVIWANHGLRAAITAMERTYRAICNNQSVSGIDHEIASLKELFALLDYQELNQSEQRFLPNAPDHRYRDAS